MLDFLISSAHAQEAAAAAAPQNPLMQFAPFILVMVVFYFMMIRPQKKKLDQEKEMNDGLKAGDEIYIKSGILGKIAGINETIVTLEIDNGVKIKVLRSFIAGKSAPLFEVKEKK